MNPESGEPTVVGAATTVRQGVALYASIGMPARNLSVRSRQEYARDLEDLTAFLAQHDMELLAEVSLSHLQTYQAEMDRRGYAPASRERKTYAIKTLFAFLYQQGLTASDIAARLTPPRRPKREPRFLSEDEYLRLLRACAHNLRDAAIVELFLQTGMRLAELCRLTVDDVELPARLTPDPENVGTVRVTRKGGGRETIPLNHKVCKALKAWLAVRPKVEHRALFVSKFRRPLSRRSVQVLMQQYLKETGIQGASVHTLRHTMATHHVAKGTDLKTLQETLGHQSLTTTALYVGLAKRAQRRALQENAL